MARYQGPTLEDVFLELCLRDGDLETAKVREQRNARSPIVKSTKSANGEIAMGNNLFVDLSLQVALGRVSFPQTLIYSCLGGIGRQFQFLPISLYRFPMAST